MNMQLHRAAVDLQPQSFLTLEHARGTSVTALAGELWITQDGDRNDHFIRAGEVFEIGADGVIVIQAQAGARLALHAPPAPRAWWTRLLASWLGPAAIERHRTPPVARLRAI